MIKLVKFRAGNLKHDNRKRTLNRNIDKSALNHKYK